MRSSRCSTALTALAVTFCASVCHADGTLTLVLPPSPAAQAARAAQKRNETRATLLPARGRASVLRGSRLTGSRAWRGGAHARAHSVPHRVVGRLGQLLIFSAIQRDPSG
ncbi:MAG TPA: hypothetical protein VGS41_17775, partial [Chthonomonadales bacterium]|nr:hypothetical protein [Chthonomonadales bacterium]